MNHFLAIDVGNTHTKWAVADSHRILREYEFPTARFVNHSKSKHVRLNVPGHFCGAIISCVVPKALPTIRKVLRHLKISRPIIVSSKMDLGIKIRYPKPDQIGADRLVNSVAAVTLYGAPAIVIDFGTAVTFDIISAQKEYLGGVIAPGLTMMTDYLYERTALLPRISLSPPKSVIGKSTVEAMRIGAFTGYRGLIREILQSITHKMKYPHSMIHMIATGGYSRRLAPKIPEIRYTNPQLTLQGLRLLYKKH